MAIKIMYLVDHYEGPQAGTEKQLLLLVEHLDRSLYEPAMTLLRPSAYLECHTFPCPVKVLNISRLASLKSLLKLLRFAFTLHRERYRLVHCFFNDASIIAPPLLWIFGIRVLVSRRDMGFWYKPQNLWVLRLVSPFVNRYLANSQAVKRAVQQYEWVPSRKISVIYNGYIIGSGSSVDLAAIPGVSEDTPVVGIVANLRQIKRIDTLIDAFALIGAEHATARLVIVGDDVSEQGRSMQALLSHQADLRGIRERVYFVGRVEDPRPFINRFTVAVLCSETEGFSNSIIEYMQAGRPIVCTNTGGNPELIQDGRNGFLVPVGDVWALASRLRQVLSDSALASRLGEAGYETIQSYTHERMVAEQMACYEEILFGKRGFLEPINRRVTNMD